MVWFTVQAKGDQFELVQTMMSCYIDISLVLRSNSTILPLFSPSPDPHPLILGLSIIEYVGPRKDEGASWVWHCWVRVSGTWGPGPIATPDNITNKSEMSIFLNGPQPLTTAITK
jgi:hypothetical protein